MGDLGQPSRGWPRQIVDGLPVPWLAPVIGDRVAWTALNAARLHEVEQGWLCQVCGRDLDPAPTAWIAVSQGEVATGGAMHEKCMHLARAVCPELRDDPSYVFTEVRRSDRTNSWEAVFERLTCYEEQHGQLPRVLPLAAPTPRCPDLPAAWSQNANAGTVPAPKRCVTLIGDNT
ncbi:hypothetical protein [Amycolatopsis alba]|uniref:hypothetical protein n=1 Tax=Amycolatopsis alba TaxID=76020 RepID=UPI00117814AA|nr:hypothetical protein [Amycolatopsis alba]